MPELQILIAQRCKTTADQAGVPDLMIANIERIAVLAAALKAGRKEHGLTDQEQAAWVDEVQGKA